MPRHPLEPVGGLGEIDLEVDPLLRAEVVRAERFARDAAEPLAELVEPVSADGQPRGHLVAAVALEQIAAGLQRRVEVEARDAPAGALAHVAVERDQERGPAVALDHARRHDPDDARMPAVAGEHQAGVALGIARLLHLGERLLEDPMVERLPLDVEALEPPGEGDRLRRIVREQQAQTVGGVPDAPDGVEPGPEHVAHVAGPKLAAGESRGLHQRPEAGPPALGQQPEPVPHQDAILTEQGHHVRDRGQRHQVEQVIRQVRRQPQRRDQRLHQLERDARPAQPARGRCVVGTLGVDHGQRGRQLGTRQVVIGDHHADAGRPRVAHRVHRGDAAVAGDHQRRAEPLGRGQPGGSEVVAVPQPVGHEADDVGARGPKRAGEQRGGALAVHVVIAVDQDGAARPHSGRDGVHRLGDAGERHGVGQGGDVGPEEAAGGRLGVLAPLHQQRGQRGREPELRGQAVDGGRIGTRGDHPAQGRRGKDVHHGRVPLDARVMPTLPRRPGTGSRRSPRSRRRSRRSGSGSAG